MPLRATIERVRAAYREAPPTGWEFAMAPVVGAFAVAAIDAVAIEVALGLPRRPSLRALHHGFELVHTVAVACWLAVWPAAYALVVRRRSAVPEGEARHRRELVAAVLVTGAACVAMRWMLADHLRRQADSVLDGRIAGILYPFLLFGCGVGVLAAQLVGWAAERLGGKVRGVVASAAFSALVAHHFVLRDDYRYVHAAIVWIAATLFGACFARPATAWLARRRLVVGGLGVLAAAGTVVAPPNAVRVELFRECGAVASWVLARTVWRLPEVAPELAAAAAREATLLAEQAPAAAPPPRVSKPVVVVVTVDALRADVLDDPAHEARFPQLTEIKRSAFHAARAVSGGSQTSVSLAAMFAGRTFSGQRWSLHGEGISRFLYPAEDPATRFPELLTRAGVRTEAFLALRFLTGDFGVARGFASEHLLTVGRKHGPVADVLTPMLAALDRLRPDEPAFFFAHLTEPHEPYDRGKTKTGSSFERYLSEVEVVDGWIGKLKARLERRAPGRAYLLVGADHGEAFGEHRTEFHTKTLYEELVRVPLLVWGPGIRPRRCAEPFALVDVGPTVLGLFGQPPQPGSLGVDLSPFARGDAPCSERRAPVVAEGRLRRAYYTRDGLKAIEDLLLKTVEVYDLARDPGELDDLFGRDPRAERALAELRAVFASLALPGYEPPYKP